MVEQFYIDLDLTGLESQLSDVQHSYTELGTAIQQITSDYKKSLSDMAGLATQTVAPMDIPPTLEPGLNQLMAQMNEMQRNVPAVQAALKQLEGLHEARRAAAASAGPRVAGNQPPPGLPDPERIRAVAEQGQELALKTLAAVDKALDENESWKSRVQKLIESEMKKVRAKISEVLSNLPGQVSTGFFGALMGSMVLGYTEKNRRRKEMGEMANMFEGGVNALFSKGSRDVVRKFSQWGENAQWQWGVGRKELQGGIKLMVDNGLTQAQMSKSFGRGLGDVGENVVTLTIGLAKHYNFSTSDAMEDVVSLVRDYGMGLSNAADLMVKMAAAGQGSSIGVKNFSRIVLASADPLSRMGVKAEDVGVFVDRLLKGYKSAGLDARYSGRQVEGVAVDMMTAFSNMDNAMKLAIARDMYKDPEGDAMGLLIRFEDGVTRLARKESSDFLDKLITSFFHVVVDRSTNERSPAIQVIMSSLNVENTTASRMFDFRAILEKGGELNSMDKKSKREFRNAFVYESEQVSDLFKTKREMILGVGKMGEGILALIVDMVGMAMIGMQGMAASASAPKGQQAAVNMLIYFKQLEIYRNMGRDLALIKEGAGLAVGALPKEFADTFAPVVEAFKSDVFEGSGLYNQAYNQVLAHPIDNLKSVMGFAESMQPWNLIKSKESSTPGTPSALDIVTGDFLGNGPGSSELVAAYLRRQAAAKLQVKTPPEVKKVKDKPRVDQADESGTPKKNPQEPEVSGLGLAERLMQARQAIAAEDSNRMSTQ